MRSILQSHFDSIGLSIQKHAGKILFVAILVFSTFCVGLKSATMHSKVQNLWIQGKQNLDHIIPDYDDINDLVISFRSFVYKLFYCINTI